MSSQTSDHSAPLVPQEIFQVHASDAEAFTRIVNTRHAVRAYLDKPVPRELLDEVLAVAQMSPSNSNTQPCRLYAAVGARRESLTDALMAAVNRGEPGIDLDLPEPFRHYRSDLGAELYGHGYGVARDDKVGRKATWDRNYVFFDAPVALVLCMDDRLEDWDALSVGLYLQTLMLACTARGLGTCTMVATAGYPDICRQELGIPSNEKILCGIALGWPDIESEKGRKINQIRWTRDPVGKSVKILE